MTDAALGDGGRLDVGDAVLESAHIRRVVRRRRQQQEGAVGSAQRAREEGPVAQLARDELGALAGEGLGLVDVAHDGADLVACGEQLASNDGPNVAGGTGDDEDGHDGWMSGGTRGFRAALSDPNPSSEYNAGCLGQLPSVSRPTTSAAAGTTQAVPGDAAHCLEGRRPPSGGWEPAVPGSRVDGSYRCRTAFTETPYAVPADAVGRPSSPWARSRATTPPVPGDGPRGLRNDALRSSKGLRHSVQGVRWSGISFRPTGGLVGETSAWLE